MKDLAVVLGTETATIILDDTISVWPEHQHNLMQVLTMSLVPSPYSCAVSAKNTEGCQQGEAFADSFPYRRK